jgi:diaminopimelate decarboxylase
VNHFEYRDGVMHCEGVSLEAIASDVGAPVYVYSSATLARHVQVFREALAPLEPLVAFAVKANGNIAVLAVLAKLGVGADTVSAGEIARALKAGIGPEKIVFSGVGKTEAELDYAVALGIHQINVESIAELELLGDVAARLQRPARLAIRVNPDVGAGGHGKINTGYGDAKFGVSRASALELYARAHAHPHLEPLGFAVHIGSQIQDLGPLEAAFKVVRAMTEEARGQGLPVTQLDLGGGLGVPYFDEPDPPPPADYSRIVRRVFDGLGVKLAFEPGRLICANAGVLVSKVVRIQDRPRPILVLDAAMNDLVRPAMYEAFHDIRAVRQPAGNAAELMDVVGPICETGDTFAKERALPPLAAGDLVAFMTAGAYGASMASTYNSRPLIAEVLVSGDKFELVRRRWEVADQLALETIPDWV